MISLIYLVVIGTINDLLLMTRIRNFYSYLENVVPHNSMPEKLKTDANAQSKNLQRNNEHKIQFYFVFTYLNFYYSQY